MDVKYRQKSIVFWRREKENFRHNLSTKGWNIFLLEQWRKMTLTE